MPSHAPPHIRSGLVSITFRSLSPEEVAAWAVRGGLAGIEWGGDIHVPHGDVAAARRVAALTRDSGLQVAAYGSYYRMGDEDPSLFPRVLETAIELGAPIIRVWAGRSGSAETDSAARALVEQDGLRIAEMAAGVGLQIATEWHGGTLTDTAASAAALFAAVPHAAFRTYWQPRSRLPAEQSLQDLRAALPRLAGIHVFHWSPGTGERLPLSAGEPDWSRYLAAVSGTPLSSNLPSPHSVDREASTEGSPQSLFALLEFVKDDDPQQMLQDAATLNCWLTQTPPEPDPR
jgi:sugar phosphate isomerase/epimerase